jgi:hypothetical protein
MKNICRTWFILSIGVGFLFCSVNAQDQKPAAEVKYGWKHSLVTGITMTQIAFTDWAQGGENALSYTIGADGKSVNELEKTNWTNTYKMFFGQTRLGNQGLRKTDDIIDLATVFVYKLGTLINPYVAATMKTQFAKGYKYPGPDSSYDVSAFFDPAYLTQSAGVGYQPMKELKTRLGIGLREVITNKYSVYYTDDLATLDKVEKVTVDGGFESVTNLDVPLDDNVLLTNQLELFAPLKTLDEVIVRDNLAVTAKVGKYITTVFNLQLINERRMTPRTQIKETISMGISYAIF